MSDSEIIITIISRKIDTLLRRIKNQLTYSRQRNFKICTNCSLYIIFCTFVV